MESPKLLEQLRATLGGHDLAGRFAVVRGLHGLVASVCGVSFSLRFAPTGSAEQIGEAIRTPPAADSELLLVVVPSMRDPGLRLCAEARVAWIDLAGNAQIEGPGVYVSIRGRERPQPRGRRPAPFSARASRVAHRLLLEPHARPSPAELASDSGVALSMVLRAAARYEEAGFLQSDGGRPRRYSLVSPDGLLDAWRADYDFSRHTVTKGHVAARSGQELLENVVGAYASAGQAYAATALAAAWLLAPHAGFRLVTLYVEHPPSPDILEPLGFREEPRGANLWLAVARDSEPLERSQETRGIRHVSAVWAYLDLKGHPERSEEAAEELRTQCLRWGRSG